MSLCIALIRFKWAIKRGTARILQLEGELKKAGLAYLYLSTCSHTNSSRQQRMYSLAYVPTTKLKSTVYNQW